MRTSAWSRGDIEIEDGKILRVGKDLPRKEEDLAVDCAGSYTVVPGFVDVHIHGCAGADTCDATREALEAMAAFLLAHGVTSFCPTTMTTSRETIQAALLAAKDMMDHPMEGGARVVGVNMEGPFIAKERKGAQKEEDILPPDFPLFQRFYEESGGIVRLVDVAPEQPGGLDFVEKASQLCTVSIAHTTADYDQAKAAFDKGVTHATHLFNAMSGLHHRKPGVVGAVFDDSRVRGELICDGFHIHPAVLRAAFRLLGGQGAYRQRLHAGQRHAGGRGLRPGRPDGHRPPGQGAAARWHHRRLRHQPAPGNQKPGFLRRAL